MFRGATKVTLDDKGRVVIPTKQRERLSARGEGHVIVTVDRDRCLQIYAPADWEPFQRWIMEQPPMEENSKYLRRLIVGHATDLELDGHGRLALPPELREYAGLTRSAMLVGQVTYFELWDEERWYSQRAAAPRVTDPTPQGPGSAGSPSP